MRAGLAQRQLAALDLVDQDPVRLNVAVPPSLPVPGESMISLARRQGLMRLQQPDDRVELLQRCPASPWLQVPVELRRRGEEQGRRGRGTSALGLDFFLAKRDPQLSEQVVGVGVFR